MKEEAKTSIANSAHLPKNNNLSFIPKTPLNDANPADKLFLNMLELFTKFERQMRGDRIRRGKKFNAMKRMQEKIST